MVDMSAAWSRLWLVACPLGERAQAVGALLGAAPLAAIVCAPSAGPAAERVLAGRRIEISGEPALDLSGDDPDGEALLVALAARVAERNAGAELALLAPPGGLRVLIRASLGLGGGDEPFELEPGTVAALEWPAEPGSGRQPLFAGLDLDWIPPRAAPARFPGGPGAAPAGR